MYVITNRVINDEEDGLKKFGKVPNPAGPNELRLLEINDEETSDVTLLDDQLPQQKVDSLATKHGLNIDPEQVWFASLDVACSVFDQATRDNKQVLLFVHGYNNDMADIVKAATDIQDSYEVVVVIFSWPANGGGIVSGTAAYLSDKDDARSSASALHRTVNKLQTYHKMLSEGLKSRLLKEAVEKHPDNRERAKQLYMRKLDKQCKIKINLLCHSMGNYVLKYSSFPGNSSLRTLVFDNIALVAADVNNPGHEQWLENLPTRNRLYVVINENDGALKWSRRKPGEEQLERLGHHLRNLLAKNAYYIDLTRSKKVGKEHSYFRSKVVKDNAKLKRIFARILEGDNAENLLEYHGDLNVYRS